MDNKVQVTAEGLRGLYKHAKKNDTVDAWAKVALEWMEIAEEHISQLSKSWIYVEPESGCLATVRLFSGDNKMLIVDHIWFLHGKPERIYGHDVEGRYFKFKMDEEPFTLIFSER